MNRRTFLKGAIGAAAALILPPEPERRFFQLDQTMIKGGGLEAFTSAPVDNQPLTIEGFIKLMEPTQTPFAEQMNHELRRIKRLEEAKLIWGLDILDNDVQEGTLGFNRQENRTYWRHSGVWIPL